MSALHAAHDPPKTLLLPKSGRALTILVDAIVGLPDGAPPPPMGAVMLARLG